MIAEEFRLLRRQIRRDKRRAKEYSLLFIFLIVFAFFSGGTFRIDLYTMIWVFFVFAAITSLLFGVYCQIRANLLTKRLRNLKQAVRD